VEYGYAGAVEDNHNSIGGTMTVQELRSIFGRCLDQDEVVVEIEDANGAYHRCCIDEVAGLVIFQEDGEDEGTRTLCLRVRGEYKSAN
jgi:hypothetical protein